MIVRDPSSAASATYDLVVVGGGIYGACVTLEAARRGLRPLLVERDDFGGGASWNSLRIVHGGLRYLQSLDLIRLRQSVRERRWFLRTFPDLVRPLACLLPLHGRGLQRPVTFGMALLMNDALSRGRNVDVDPSRHLPAGRVLSVEETAEMYPAVRRQGLRGGGLWHDAVMPSSERVLVEILRWACSAGATALNYVEAEGLAVSGGRVEGLEARDRETGDSCTFRAKVVVNCAGPDCRAFAAHCDRDEPALFLPSLAFNVLLDVDSPAPCGVAVTPERPGARSHFLLPWPGGTLAGTFHVPAEGPGPYGPPSVAEEHVLAFLSDLRDAVPGLPADRGRVRRVLAGWQPARREGGDVVSTRPVTRDHGATGGPVGFFTVSGVKYTTARLVAERALAKIYGRDLARVRPDVGRPEPVVSAEMAEPGWLDRADADEARDRLARAEAEEAVVHLDDLLLRRTTWAMDPTGAVELGERVCDLLEWDADRRASELARLRSDPGNGTERLTT